MRHLCLDCRAQRTVHSLLQCRFVRQQPRGRIQAAKPPQISEEVESHIAEMKGKSEKMIQDGGKGEHGKFKDTWAVPRGGPGSVPYRFRLQEPEGGKGKGKGKGDQTSSDVSKQAQKSYSDYSGLRFPTLETAENYDYHKDRGLTRLIERAFPIKVPGYRRLDPYLREYIFFLHNLDPARFTVSRIAQRYRMREKTVAKVVQEWGANRYLTRTGLTRLSEKQTTKEEVVLAKKEQQYAKWVGWDQLGDEDDLESDDEALGEFKGWRSTSDWVRRQTVEVEMMSAFPMMEKRDPMPKRVDVDMVVESKQHHKIINWIDPSDKVVF
eukprot:TRINITY_DN15230_c0_g1_i1.p1 TRINITY_DN15230_c0_g1~~TRINITY_DN15230_c0_g1_i1.p1  ORF type:complete len:340 (+),score=63.89 TRINITY_DN15230_c0_g1_i1:49-1020(+)